MPGPRSRKKVPAVKSSQPGAKSASKALARPKGSAKASAAARPKGAVKPKPAAMEKAVAEFKALFRAARLEHTKAGKNATPESPAHQAALAHARRWQIPGAEALLQALPVPWNRLGTEEALSALEAVLETMHPGLRGHAENLRGLLLMVLRRFDEAIACQQRALNVTGYDTPGSAHTNMGNCYFAKGEPDRAIECYEKALATQEYAMSGMVHFNLGVAYNAKREHDRAIKCFMKALEMPGFDRVAETHINLGVAFGDKGDHDCAIGWYEKALAMRGYDTPGYAYNNMGNSYAAKGEYERAIECYSNALVKPGEASTSWARNNLALTLRDLGKYDLALGQLARVLEAPDEDGQHERARRIRAMIEEDMAGLKATAGEEALVKAESADGARAAEETVEQRMLKKLGLQEEGRKDKYDEYLERVPSHGRAEVFSCLRGWSSAVTLLEGGGDGRKWRGGGYFIKWQGKGIVLDPGFDFLDNFHDAGHLLHEVDAVLVSHNHPDHNYDLHSLDDLRYELHRRWKVKKVKGTAGTMDLSRCLFVLDEDTAKASLTGGSEHRGYVKKFTDYDWCQKRWLEREHGLPFSLEHFKVKHTGDVPNAVGMRLRLHQPGAPDVVLGYTGDTAWFTQEEKQPDSVALAEELRGCDVLLAHISMPDQEEFKDPELLKRGHLGYNGLARLIVETEPKVVLVGEFWAGLADLRIDLVRGLKGKVQNALGREIPILPTGLGFHLDLTTLQVHCTGCGEARVPLAELKVAPAASAFGPLGYLCRRCLC